MKDLVVHYSSILITSKSWHCVHVLFLYLWKLFSCFACQLPLSQAVVFTTPHFSLCLESFSQTTFSVPTPLPVQHTPSLVPTAKLESRRLTNWCHSWDYLKIQFHSKIESLPDFSIVQPWTKAIPLWGDFYVARLWGFGFISIILLLF